MLRKLVRGRLALTCTRVRQTNSLASPAGTSVGLRTPKTSLLGDERAVASRHARVFSQGIQHAQRGFCVVGGAVCVLEVNAQTARDLAKGARALSGLQFTRPNERVKPIDLASQRRGKPFAGGHARTARFCEEKSSIEFRVVGCRHRPLKEREHFGGDVFERWSRGHVGIGDVVDGSRFRRNRHAGVHEPSAARDDLGATPDHDPDFDDAIGVRVTARGLNVEERDREILPLVLRVEFARHALHVRPEKMRDSWPVATRWEAATRIVVRRAHGVAPTP